VSTPFEVGDRARVLESAELGDVRCILPGGWIELELGPGTLITVQPEQIALVARTRVPAAVELEPSPISARELLAEGDSAAGRYAQRILARAELLRALELHMAHDYWENDSLPPLFKAMRGYLVAECDDAIEPESEGPSA